jgi:hypothetical protein
VSGQLESQITAAFGLGSPTGHLVAGIYTPPRPCARSAKDCAPCTTSCRSVSVPSRGRRSDGPWCGHVDFGALGVADRWADLAIATWSTEWNYGPGWQAPLLDAYGIEADPDRIRYYRLLGDLAA